MNYSRGSLDGMIRPPSRNGREEKEGLDVFLTEEEQIMNRLFSIFPGFVCDIYFDNYFFPLRYYF